MLFTEDRVSFLVYRRELGRYIIAPREVVAVEGSLVCDRKAKEKEKRPSSGTSVDGGALLPSGKTTGYCCYEELSR